MEKLEKCSKQHMEIYWSLKDNMLLGCPVCSIRKEAGGIACTERELEEKEIDIRVLEEEKGDLKGEVDELEGVIEKRDEVIEERDEAIEEHQETIKGLENRISRSVLGEIDRLKETVEYKEEVIGKITKEKDKTIRERERDLTNLERKIVPPHIPFEQYERYLEEKRNL